MLDLTTRPLFGGAIECGVPATFIDTSEFRQVPDNQEVWVASHGNDVSLIVELVEAIELAQDDIERSSSRAEVHFTALAQDNGALAVEVTARESQSCTIAETAVRAEVVAGVQGVPKYGKIADTTRVHIALACLHLGQFDTDVLITLNVPASGAAIGQEQVLEVMRRVVASFELKDSSLFG